MSNFKKSFSFRSGVQVDNDNFVVTPLGTVGIGTTIPTQFLDVRGSAAVSGVVTTNSVYATGISTFNRINLGSGIKADASSGIITATKFYGDGSTLSNLPTSQWVDIDQPGLGFTSIYAQGNVGIATTFPNANFSLQIGGYPVDEDGVGISSRGHIQASGIITANQFVGSGAGLTSLNASNLSSGTISNDRLPIINNSKIPNNIQLGIITATNKFSGNLVGFASTAYYLAGKPDIDVGIITATKIEIDEIDSNKINSNFATSGIITATNSLRISNTFAVLGNGNVGVGTILPTSDFQIKKSTNVDVEFITSSDRVLISIGNSVGLGNSSASFSYESKTLNITNNDTGGVSVNLNEGTGSGTPLGFKVRYDNSNLMHISTEGKLAINKETPEYNLDVDGSAYISGDARVVGVITVGSGANAVTLGDGNPLPISEFQNFNTLTGISTFNQLNVRDRLSVGATAIFTTGVASFAQGVGIGTSTIGDYLLKNQGKSYFTDDVINQKNLVVALDPNSSPLSDPRTIPNQEPFSSSVPLLDYGRFQVQKLSASFVSQQVLIVPYVGQITSGYGAPDLGITYGGSYASDKYLSRLGINTYFARSVLDVGAASTSTNSYFIPPSVTQDELDIIRTLHLSPSNLGYGTIKKLTPNGVVPGAIVFNKTNSRLEIGLGSTTFNGIPVLTNNHTGYETIVLPKVTNTQKTSLINGGIDEASIIYNETNKRIEISTDAIKFNGIPVLDTNNSGYESFVPPRLTTAQRNTLTSNGIQEGAIIYNIEENTLQEYDGTNWSSLVKQTSGDQVTISVDGGTITFTSAGLSTSFTLVSP